MNPLIQLNRQLQYLFIALLIACFAIAQSGRAVTPQPDGGDPNGNTAEEEMAVLNLSNSIRWTCSNHTSDTLLEIDQTVDAIVRATPHGRYIPVMTAD